MPDVKREDDAESSVETTSVEETRARQVIASATDVVMSANASPSDLASSRAKLKGTLFSIARSPSVRASVFVFALTRLIVFSLFVLTAKLDITHPVEQGGGAARLSLHSTAFSRILVKRTSVGDCAWYMRIVLHGYEHRPFTTEAQTDWAFFPLFPLIFRAAWRVTGELHLTGIAISSLCFFLALVFLHKLALACDFGARDADRAIFYLAAFPVSYFFSVPMTESLFLLLTVGSFYAAKREQWLVAGLLGALASATRSTGVLLLPALALLYWETYRTLRPRWNFLPLLLIPTGLLSFMWYLHTITGNAFAFKDILVTWGRKPTFFLTTLFEYLCDPLLLAISWNFRFVNFVAVVGAMLCGVALLMWRKWSLAAYTLASIFITLSSGLLQSQARYASVLFPAFLALAVWGRKPRTDQIIRTVFLVLLVLMTILFSDDIDIALS